MDGYAKNCVLVFGAPYLMSVPETKKSLTKPGIRFIACEGKRGEPESVFSFLKKPPCRLDIVVGDFCEMLLRNGAECPGGWNVETGCRQFVFYEPVFRSFKKVENSCRIEVEVFSNIAGDERGMYAMPDPTGRRVMVQAVSCQFMTVVGKLPKALDMGARPGFSRDYEHGDRGGVALFQPDKNLFHPIHGFRHEVMDGDVGSHAMQLPGVSCENLRPLVDGVQIELLGSLACTECLLL